MKHAFDFNFSVVVMFQLFSNFANAAACCGGGVAMPSMIAGDDKAQLTSSVSMTEITIDNVDASGIWRTSDVHQQIKTLKIEGAHIFWDRFQAGFSIPLIERQRESQKFTGLGDVATSVGYEYLPDWNYNPYRPKGIGYLQLTFPTGKSRADSEVGGLDSRGNGFWAIGLGTLLTKSWTRFDSLFSIEVHRAFSDDVESTQFKGTLNPGFGGNAGIGLGYNINSYRIGTMITWTYEDAVKAISKSGLVNPGSIERYATGTISAAYMASDEWSGSLSFSDQTLFGSPVNTSLGKSLALQVQRRWGR